MDSHEVFIHIHQGCFAGTGAIVRLTQCQWSKPDGYGKISQCITTTKHSKAKTVCIFLGVYCKGCRFPFWALSISIYANIYSYGDTGQYTTVLIYIFMMYIFAVSWNVNFCLELTPGLPFWAMIQYSTMLHKLLDKIVVLPTLVSISSIGRKLGLAKYDFSGIKIGSMHLQMALHDPKSCHLHPVIPYKTVKCKPLCCRDTNGVWGGGGMTCSSVRSSFVCPSHHWGFCAFTYKPLMELDSKFVGWTHYGTSSA